MTNLIDIQHLLGIRIRGRRRQLGLTQGTLALRAGLSRPSIANLEAGRQNVGLRQLVSLARALELDLGELFDRSEIASNAATTANP